MLMHICMIMSENMRSVVHLLSKSITVFFDIKDLGETNVITFDRSSICRTCAFIFPLAKRAL